MAWWSKGPNDLRESWTLQNLNPDINKYTKNIFSQKVLKPWLKIEDKNS